MKKALLLLFFLSLKLAAQQGFDEASAREFQSRLNSGFADAEKSPLTKKDLKAFHGLDFFPITLEFSTIATLKKTDAEKPFAMKTTTSRTPTYVKYGELTFSLKGKNFRLNVYRDVELSKKPGYENHLFLPFSDLGNGRESYLGGRYIDLEIPSGDTIVIDFNKAYNPYCAYNHKYSCPVVPLENDLDIEVRAGVKKFHD